MSNNLYHASVNGYNPVRALPTGQVIGVADMLFTTGLFVGIDEYGYSHRFCYATRSQAEQALREWDGTGDPPGPWIKEKPSGRLGPGAASDLQS